LKYNCKLQTTKIIAKMPRKLTTNEFIDAAKAIHEEMGYDYSQTTYLGGSKPINFICPSHGKVQLSQAQCHIYPCGKRLPIGCPKCGIEKKHNSLIKRNKNNSLTKENFAQKATNIHGARYDYSNSDYNGVGKTINIYCNLCKTMFFTRAGSHIYGKTPVGCPNCVMSNGEKSIFELLSGFGIKFVQQKKIKNTKLRWDFYLPNADIYIEFHGRQHFEPVDYFGGIEGFCSGVRRDLIKMRWVIERKKILLSFDDIADMKPYEYYFICKFPKNKSFLRYETKRMIFNHCDRLQKYIKSLPEIPKMFPVKKLAKIHKITKHYLNTHRLVDVSFLSDSDSDSSFSDNSEDWESLLDIEETDVFF